MTPTATSCSTRLLAKAPLFIFLFALLIRAGYCAWTHRGPYAFREQYREYIIAGQRLLEHGSFLSPFMADAATAEVSAVLPPLYTIWIATVYAVCGVESAASIWVIEVSNSIALALACALVFCISDVIGSRAAAWTGGIIAAVHPALIGHVHYVWDTSFFALAVTTSIWIALKLRLRPFRARDFVGFGLWLGLIALLNPALTPAYPLLVLFPLLRSRRVLDQTVLQGVGLSILGWMTALTPWTVRNYIQFDRLSYVRSGLMLEVWLGVVPEADVAGGPVYRTHFPLSNPEVSGYVSQVGEKSYLAECGAKARQAIAADPLRYLKLVGMRTLDYWLGSTLSHATPSQGFIPSTNPRRIIFTVYAGETLLVLLAICTRRLRGGHIWWLCGILVVFSVIYSLTHVQVRFRVPVEPIAAVLLGLILVRNRQATHTNVSLA